MNKGLKAKVARFEQNHEELIIINKDLGQYVEQRDKELQKIFGESQKFSKLVLLQKSPLCKLVL